MWALTVSQAWADRNYDGTMAKLVLQKTVSVKDSHRKRQRQDTNIKLTCLAKRYEAWRSHLIKIGSLCFLVLGQELLPPALLAFGVRQTPQAMCFPANLSLELSRVLEPGAVPKHSVALKHQKFSTLFSECTVRFVVNLWICQALTSTEVEGEMQSLALTLCQSQTILLDPAWHFEVSVVSCSF